MPMGIKKPFKNAEKVKNIGIFCWSIIGLLIIGGLILYLLYLIRAAIIPLIIATAIAYLLTPIVFFLQKKIRRIFAVIIAYIIFLGIVFIFFFFIIPLVTDQFEIFVENLPKYIENLAALINQFLTESHIAQNIEHYMGTDFLPQDTETITGYFLDRVDINGLSIVQPITAFTKNIINLIIIIIIGPILGFYILKDSNRLRKIFLKLMPDRLRAQAVAIVDRINMVSARYIRGQLLASIIVGIMCTIALLALRVDFAVLLGFIAGALNLMPFLGPVLGAIPAALIALFISPLRALLVVLIFIAIQQIDSYFIYPLIMKHQIRLHPGIIIFSLIAGGAIFGLLGLLLAVPLVAMLQEILKYYLFERKYLNQ